MPIYEYECTECGRVEEAWQSFSDKPLKTCKHCSGKLRKCVSQCTFHLKGTGWYVTDYADKPAGSATKSRGKTADAKSESADKVHKKVDKEE